jgi:hypothetical protein
MDRRGETKRTFRKIESGVLPPGEDVEAEMAPAMHGVKLESGEITVRARRGWMAVRIFVYPQ